MNCPKCRRKAMTRFPGSVGPDVWLCSRCGGVWVPDGKAANAEPPEDLVSATTVVDSDSRAGLCPAGHGILSRARLDVGEGFYLDRCSHCSGVWFDAGEWQQVSAAGLSAGLFAIWTEPWQRRQREARTETA